MKETVACITLIGARHTLTALAVGAQQAGSHRYCTYPNSSARCVPCRHFIKAPCVKLAALIS